MQTLTPFFENAPSTASYWFSIAPTPCCLEFRSYACSQPCLPRLGVGAADSCFGSRSSFFCFGLLPFTVHHDWITGIQIRSVGQTWIALLYLSLLLLAVSGGNAITRLLYFEPIQGRGKPNRIRGACTPWYTYRSRYSVCQIYTHCAFFRWRFVVHPMHHTSRRSV